MSESSKELQFDHPLILQGNQLEDLRHLMVSWMQANPLKPFEDEVILVQSNGIAQWLKLALAADPEKAGGLGIAAGIQVMLPGRFIWQAYRKLFPQLPSASPFDKGPLTWRLQELLNRLPELKTRLADPSVLDPLQHFLNALIRNELKEEGFKVNIIRYDSVTSEYSTPLNPKPVEELLQVSQTGDEFLFELVVEEDIEVTYINEFESSDYKKRYRSKSTKGNYSYTDKKARSSIAISDNERLTSYQIYGVDITDVDLFQKSIIFFEEKKLQVGYPGFFLDQRAVAFGGWWVWEGFSEMLPVDYLPSTK